jgi:protein-disulfide isomerase
MTFNPSRRLVMAALAAAPLVAAAKPKPAPRLSAKISETGIGAYVAGNPDAKLRLVQYFSYTCGACGAFAAAADAPLKTGYIDRGLVAFEYRNLVRDPLDLTAALLARAGGPTAFPGHYRALMAGQPQWLAAATKLPRAVQEKWYEGSLSERAARIARDSGLGALMRARGLTAAQIEAALNNEVAQAAVTAMTNLARGADRIHSTPGFLLQGKQLDHVHDWASVKSRLDQALRPA